MLHLVHIKKDVHSTFTEKEDGSYERWGACMSARGSEKKATEMWVTSHDVWAMARPLSLKVLNQCPLEPFCTSTLMPGDTQSSAHKRHERTGQANALMAHLLSAPAMSAIASDALLCHSESSLDPNQQRSKLEIQNSGKVTRYLKHSRRAWAGLRVPLIEIGW